MRRVSGLKRFLYVGTAYICGEQSQRIVREDDFPRYGVRHVVEYTASKAECEMLLEATAPELPLVIARPSVVIGHTKLGCLPSASIFWFYRTADLLRRLTCPLDTFDDVVPVDYVADALLHLLFKPELRTAAIIFPQERRAASPGRRSPRPSRSATASVRTTLTGLCRSAPSNRSGIDSGRCSAPATKNMC